MDLVRAGSNPAECIFLKMVVSLFEWVVFDYFLSKESIKFIWSKANKNINIKKSKHKKIDSDEI